MTPPGQGQRRAAATLRWAALAAALAAGPAGAAADDDPPAGDGAAGATPGRPAPVAWQVELKRAVTSRGSPEESTRTTLRVERLLDGTVSRLRVDLPFVDRTSAAPSDPADVGPGDVKVRVGLRLPSPAWARLAGYLELALPTASPAALGSGTYQPAVGGSATMALPTPWAAASPRLWLVPDVKQVVSVAGDPDRAEVSYLATELKLEADWPQRALLALTPKPVFDWTEGGRSSAVIELKGTWILGRAWRAWLTAGHRLWGEGGPGSYDTRIELGVRLGI